MSTEDTLTGDAGKANPYHFDRHTPEYRERFTAITEDMQARCPVAWTDTYGGHWVAAGNREVFELARCPHVSNDRDVTGERPGYDGVSIATPPQNAGVRGGMLEMDEPEHTVYRSILNPYLSPAAVKRWVPFVDEIVRASIDEKIESRADRLRRRSRERRTRRPDSGDDGRSSEEMDALLRAGPRRRVHTRRFPASPKGIGADGSDGNGPARPPP